jgi:hypothetical protein
LGAGERRFGLDAPFQESALFKEQAHLAGTEHIAKEKGIKHADRHRRFSPGAELP